MDNIQGLGILQWHSSVRDGQGIVRLVLVFSRSIAVWMPFCDIGIVFVHVTDEWRYTPSSLNYNII